MPLLPSGGIGLRDIAGTAVAEFVGGRAAQVAANLAGGAAWHANLLNPLDIALDVLPGVAAATWRTVRAGRAAARAAEAARQADMLYVPHELGGEAGSASLDAASLGLGRRVRGAGGRGGEAVEAARLLPAGEPASLAGQPICHALVPYGEYGTVLKATPADAEGIRAFGRVAEEWQAARGQRSFGSLYWETVARRLETGPTDEWFVHYSGSSVTGAMKVVSRPDILEIKTLEALGGGSGTRLMQAAVNESIARGFRGKIQLHAAPQAIRFYQKLGPSFFNPVAENLFIWDEGAARFLLHNFH